MLVKAWAFRITTYHSNLLQPNVEEYVKNSNLDLVVLKIYNSTYTRYCYVVMMSCRAKIYTKLKENYESEKAYQK